MIFFNAIIIFGCFRILDKTSSVIIGLNNARLDQLESKQNEIINSHNLLNQYHENLVKELRQQKVLSQSKK